MDTQKPDVGVASCLDCHLPVLIFLLEISKEYFSAKRDQEYHPPLSSGAVSQNT